jgi:hypothetical protein
MMSKVDMIAPTPLTTRHDTPRRRFVPAYTGDLSAATVLAR